MRRSLNSAVSRHIRAFDSDHRDPFPSTSDPNRWNTTPGSRLRVTHEMPDSSTSARPSAGTFGTSGNDRPSSRSCSTGSARPRSRSWNPGSSWASHTTATAGQWTWSPATSASWSARQAAAAWSARAVDSVPASGSSQTTPFAEQYGRRRSAISPPTYRSRAASRSASSDGTPTNAPTTGRGSHSAAASRGAGAGGRLIDGDDAGVSPSGKAYSPGETLTVGLSSRFTALSP